MTLERHATGLATRLAAMLAAALVALAAGGCSPDDVALNGKIFDAVGMNGSKNKGALPKMVARAPLVVPPGLDRLPVPGAPAETSSAEVAALADPDKLAVKNQADLERQQIEYCKKNYEIPKMLDKRDLEEVEGPLGLCRQSAWRAYKEWNSSAADQEGQTEK